MADVNATGMEEQIWEKWRVKIWAYSAALGAFRRKCTRSATLSMKKLYTAKCVYAGCQDVWRQSTIN